VVHWFPVTKPVAVNILLLEIAFDESNGTMCGRIRLPEESEMAFEILDSCSYQTLAI